MNEFFFWAARCLVAGLVVGFFAVLVGWPVAHWFITRREERKREAELLRWRRHREACEAATRAAKAQR